MIVVGFTTTPDRLAKGLTKRCIQSLLKSRVSPDYIVVNIPSTSRKGVAYSEDAMKELKAIGDHRVIVRWGIKDEGPITKLFGTLDFIKELKVNRCRIILVDDDVVYEPNMISFLSSFKDVPAAGIAARSCTKKEGTIVDVPFHDASTKTHVDVCFLETFASVIYDSTLFDVAAMREWVKTLPDEVIYVDDIVIAAWLFKQGVKPQKVVPAESLYGHDASGTEQLSSTNLAGRNLKIVQQLCSQGYFCKRDASSNTFQTPYAFLAWITAFTLIAGIIKAKQ